MERTRSVQKALRFFILLHITNKVHVILMKLSSKDKIHQGEGVTPHNGLYREATHERGTLYLFLGLTYMYIKW